ncbi:MAG: OmpA family protein [bacterium]
MKISFKKFNDRLFLIFLIISIIVNNIGTLSGQESARYTDSLLGESQYFNTNVWSVGIFGGVLLNNHYVDFHALPTVPSCCPDYQTGFGTKMTFGALFDYKLFRDYNIFAELRAAYSNIGGTIKAEERELMFYSPTESVMGLIEHTIETSINSISLQPIIMYGIFDNTYLHLGMSFAYINSTSFEQKETLIEPKDLTFENGSKIRMNYGGSIPDVADFYSSVLGGLNYDLALSKKKDWFLSPEVFLEYNLNNLIPNEKWNVLSVRMALALNYRKGIEEIERFEQFEKIDTVKIEMPTIAENKIVVGKPTVYYDSLKVQNVLTITENYFRTDTLFTPPEYVMTASLKITALEDNGREIHSPDIKVEEFLYNKMQPILNYVFFDSNSYAIPERYNILTNSQAKDFNLNRAFTKKELGFYHNILNIIGYKLKQNTDANITLIGSNYNLDAEKNNLTLSKNRAQAVKDYLANVWQINPDRISVKARNLPATPSNNRAIEGHEENRRVEIYSDNFRITSSLIARDTILEIKFIDNDDPQQRNLNFGGFRIYTSANSEKEIKDWKLVILQGNDTLETFTGRGTIPPIHDWIVKSDVNKSELLSKPINFVFSASDIGGKQVNIKEVPKVDVKTIASKRLNREQDTKKDSYSMMLFEFGSARFTEENKDFPNIIRRLLKDNSQVKVIGYSDSFGNDDFNLRLSTQRADAVAKAINHPNITSQGVGETMLLYNNDSPEGRFYCRTVDIISETPIHW